MLNKTILQTSRCVSADIRNPVQRGLQRGWLCLAISCVLASVSISESQAQWRQFRGPNGTGHANASELPDRLLPSEALWRVELPPGHSSPVVLGDSIVVTGLEGEELVTIRLDRRTGREIWKRAERRPRHEKIDERNHPASPSAIVDEDGVCVFFPEIGLIAYDWEGMTQWTQPLGPFNNLYGMGASPILVDDKIVLACDQNTKSFVAAFNRKSGKQVWRVDRDAATSGHSTPVVRTRGDGRKEILLPGTFVLTSYDAETGEKLWWSRGLCFEMKSTPVFDEERIYVNGYGSPMNQPGAHINVDTFADVIKAQDKDDSGDISLDEAPDNVSKAFFPGLDLDGNSRLDEAEWNYFRAAMASENSMMAIRFGDQGDVTDSNIVWKYHRNIPQLPSPVLVEGRLYMIDDQGIATVFDAATGDVLTRGRLEGANGNYYASPVVADGKIYFLSLEGKSAVIPADGSLNVIAAGDFEELCYATPAITEDRIYVRTEKALYAFGK